MNKILVVMGTRPEAIKLAPVIQTLREASGRFEVRILVTAQHRDMLDQVLNVFSITVDYDLDIMEASQTPSQVAAAVFARLEPILQLERPDWLVIQGDTTTVAAAAMAGFYARVRVAHVEAGLRTRDRTQPFPEEINRRLAGVLADLHFAPTAGARDNLLKEGVPPSRILVTGNPVIDALHCALRRKPPPSGLWERLNPARKLILMTAHRRENFGPRFEAVCQAVRALADRHRDRIQVVYPVHRNPHIWGPAHRILDGHPAVVLVPPVDYLTLVHLLQRSYFVLTDSGGLQEEAPGLGKPVLVLRDVTERPEAVVAGTVRLVGADPRRILEESERLLTDPEAYGRMARAVNPYGDGKAAQRIAAALAGEPVEPFVPEPCAAAAGEDAHA